MSHLCFLILVDLPSLAAHLQKREVPLPARLHWPHHFHCYPNAVPSLVAESDSWSLA